ncbi:MAG: helix-turn-helix transcriptional regulator [Flavisolibacter sp.]
MSNSIQLTAFERAGLEKVRLYICAHPGEALLPSMLAAEAGISVHKLRGGFQQLHGISLSRFIRKVRMERAKELLLATNELISSIGRDCGYGDESSFHRAFKNYAGVTPDAFRKR